MKASFPEPEIVMRKGKPVSVILAIKDYHELLERVEDAEDAAALKRVRRKPLRYGPLSKREDTGLPVSAGRRPIKVAEVDKILAETT